MNDRNKERRGSGAMLRDCDFLPAIAGVGVFEVMATMKGFAPLAARDQKLAGEKLVVTKEIQRLMEQAARGEAAGATARLAGDEAAAEGFYREAFNHASDAAKRAALAAESPARLEILRVAAGLGLHCGEAARARQLIREALASDDSVANAEDWAQLREVTAWPDAWLIATVRREPPDEAALDVLVERHWKTLFGRCLMLTLNQNNAADLAQETWRRVLRTRQRLNPGGRFAAYLITIATNIWRDTQRSFGRAGPLAQNRLISLNDTLGNEENDSGTLLDVLPDLRTSGEQERRLLALDIDQALGQLPPLLREVLTARYLSGESCAEIGRRYGRTEQTISGWVRAATGQMKLHLTEAQQGTAQNLL